MASATRTTVVDGAGLERLLAPRDDLVREVAAGPDRFSAADGPFDRYERVVTSRPLGEGRSEVTVTVDFHLAVPGWGIVFVPVLRRALTGPPLDRTPWWSPPDRLDVRAATSLGHLLTASLVVGYLGTLLTQTLTFAADQFGSSDRAQGVTLASVRASIVPALLLAAMADRVGRRKVLIASAVAAVLCAALGAAAPNLAVLGATQVVARGFSTAVAILLAIVAAEEMPAGSRAYAISVLAMAAALGAGVCLWALPLADVASGGWRVVYLIPLLALPLVRIVAHGLPETRRFTAPHADAPVAGHGRRLWLLGASSFLLALFGTPAAGFLNEFLREDRGYSAAGITAFSILTNTPGGIGIVVGGHLADVRGRRRVGAMVGAAAVPALGVYGPELFPTSLRGRANGIIAGLGVAGGAIGLVVAGSLSDRMGGIGQAVAVLAVGPAVLTLLILLAYPETAHRELEELNPEDRLPAEPPAPLRPAPPRSGPGRRPR